MSFSPTAEQQAIYDAFEEGLSITIQARAGTGKTTTMVGVGQKALELEKRGFYLVYNKKAQLDAEKRFPKNVSVKTAHGLAYKPVLLSKEQSAAGYPLKDRLNGPRVTRKEVCQILGIRAGMGDQDTFLSASKLAGFVMDTVKNFCYSDATKVTSWHVPRVLGTEDYRDEFVAFCVSKAQQAWSDITSNNGRLKFEHDHYLKMFAMSDPKLDGDFVLLDEAQDANPVIAQIVNNQTHMQRIMVGDSCQSIYAWRGAIDALASFKSDKTLYLSKSFRFGPAVAEEANKWLALLGETVMVEGHEPVGSVVAAFDELLPDGAAILCRTNAEVMAQAMGAQGLGKRVAIVGGAAALEAYAEAARDLMDGKGTWHHELCAFTSWSAVQQYCIEEKEEAGSLAVMVRMIDNYGPESIIEMARRCTNEDDADVIISTAHKAKGAEWDYVQIGLDFVPVKQKDSSVDGLPSRADMMLAYVSVTRAKKQLDNRGLSWVNNFIERRNDESS